MNRLTALSIIGTSLACSHAAGTDAPLERSALAGRLFFTALNRTPAPLPGHPVARKLYVIPATGEAPPQTVTPDDLVFGLVGYPPRHAVGINLLTGASRGSYLVDTGAPSYNKSPLIRLPAQIPFTAADWVDPSAPPSTPQLRHLFTQIVLAPDGQHVAGIVSSRMRMCVLPSEGSGDPVCAADIRACDSHFPSWSPSGAAIVFAGAIKADRSSCNLQELFVMDASTGTTRQLTDIPGDRLGREMREAIVAEGDPTNRWHKSNHPAWSPDGQWIAFNSPKGISLIHPDGTSLHVIIKPPGLTPAWSPDGAFIAYRLPHRDASNQRRFPRRFDIPWVIHVARADGSGDVQVSDDSGDLAVMELVWMD